MLPKKTCYEVVPPNIIDNWSIKSLFVRIYAVFGRYCAYPSAPFDLGIIVSLTNGSPPLKNHPHTACPA